MIAQEVGHLLTIGDVRVNNNTMQLHEHISHPVSSARSTATAAG
jgi:hypothetical protein